MKPVVTFGEIMCRLASPGNLRLRQTRELEVTYAGAEAGVAASVCNFGGEARYVTALPKHALAEATMDSLRSVGIDTKFVKRTNVGRLGVYFLETGANQRPSNVIYDRADSAIAITPADQYDWNAIFDGAQWLHLSGITPALSENAAQATLVAAQKAQAAGLQVSIDLNFRKKLWDWNPSQSARELAEETIRGILPHVDVIIANEEDCSDVLGIHAAETDVEAGALNTARYPDVARQVAPHHDPLVFIEGEDGLRRDFSLDAVRGHRGPAFAFVIGIRLMHRVRRFPLAAPIKAIREAEETHRAVRRDKAM